MRAHVGLSAHLLLPREVSPTKSLCGEAGAKTTEAAKRCRLQKKMAERLQRKLSKPISADDEVMLTYERMTHARRLLR
jgi:hypothetical protein